MNLYQTLIVEDNAMYRYAVRTIVDWERCGFEIAAEAVNGKQALELLDRSHYDLILTDVSMPEMNGIDLVQAVKTRAADTVIVMLSSYDDFQFVKDSLKLGAEDYLLKQELEPEALHHMLGQIRRRLQQSEAQRASEAASRRLACELRLAQWLAGGGPPTAADEAAFAELLPDGGYELALLAGEGAADGSGAVRALAEAERGQAQVEAAAVTAIPLRADRLVLLGAAPGVGAAADGRADIGGGAGSAARRWLRAGGAGGGAVRAAAATGAHRRDGLRGLRAACLEAERLLFRAVYDGGGRLFEAERSASAAASAAGAAAPAVDAAAAARWAAALRKGEAEELAAAAADVFAALRRSRPPKASLKQQLVDLYAPVCAGMEAGARDWLTELTGGLERLEPLESFRERLVAACRERFGEAEGTSGCRKEIRQALAYIREHYAEEISVAELSRRLGFSANYLSNLFRSETGMRVTEYVNKVRMEMAKRLLRETQLKVYEVASRVGYQETSYFCKVFKEVTGETVTDFRRKA